MKPLLVLVLVMLAHAGRAHAAEGVSTADVIAMTIAASAEQACKTKSARTVDFAKVESISVVGNGRLLRGKPVIHVQSESRLLVQMSLPGQGFQERATPPIPCALIITPNTLFGSGAISLDPNVENDLVKATSPGDWIAMSMPGGRVAPAWKKHSYPAEGFEIEFSGPVEVRREDVSEKSKGAVLSLARFSQDTQAGGHAVWVTVFAKPNPRWEEGAKGAIAALKCSAIGDQHAQDAPGARILQMTGTGCMGGKRSVIARFIQAGNRIYQVMAIALPKGPEADDARRFVQSFALIQ